jgi:EAL domain-containing protein (putative c-di-GMP-specific phosphodiesterase class I)
VGGRARAYRPEDSGLIVPIGAWVLGEACRQAQRWQADLGADTAFEMSVNLSARQLFHADLVETVRGTMADAGVDAGGSRCASR